MDEDDICVSEGVLTRCADDVGALAVRPRDN